MRQSFSCDGLFCIQQAQCLIRLAEEHDDCGYFGAGSPFQSLSK